MDKTVRLWHISRRECLCCFQHIDFVTAIAFHPRVSYFSQHKYIKLGTRTLFIATLYSCFSQDDRYFLSGSLDGKLRLWNIPDKKVALWNEVDGQTRLITAANFCQNGKYAVIGTYDGRCIFYDTEVPSHGFIMSLLPSFCHDSIHSRLFFCSSASEIPHSNSREVHQRQEQSWTQNHRH